MAERRLGILRRADGEADASARRTLGTGGLGPVVLGLSVFSSLATFLVLAGFTPIEATHRAVVTTLAINAAFALFLLVLIVRELRRIRRARKTGQPGAELHSRVVRLFGLVAAAPALALATMATITIDRGLDEWFSTRAHAVLTNAVVVARAYLNDQARSIHAEILAMANDINRERSLFDTNRSNFHDFLTMQATVRGMSTAWLMHSNGKIVDQVTIGGTPIVVPPPPPSAFDPAHVDEPAILSPGAQDLIGAVFKLSNYDDLWLFVTRPVDPKATQYLRNTEEAATEYSLLAQRRFGVQVAFGLMYFVIALTLLLASIWLGLAFASSLVAPLRRLIAAADQVTVGNLYVQVPVGERGSDLGGLSETFNRMTAQLRTQRNALLDASEQIDRRRRFTEAVLSGVSAGVVGLDGEGRVTLLNRTAEALLAASEAELLGRPLSDAVPEFAELFADARGALRPVQRTVVVRRAARERTLSVRLAAEPSGGPEAGAIVTFDDISDLVSAQRTAAWADVARRIAHEIKNPLTPIQLSAERIRRKYGKQIEDREVFDQCTNTIVRQVDDIKRMVDEFSSFARMPKPVMEPEDLGGAVAEVAIMMRDGYPDIAIDYRPPAAPILARFDRRLINRALTNVVKNAAESVRAAVGEGGGGAITVTLSGTAARAVVDVVDNGVGLPSEHRSRLLEPYVTTREKGTGLGLAIVAKIAEEHGGGIELLDSPAVADGGRGALVRLWFSLDGTPAAPAPEAAIESEH